MTETQFIKTDSAATKLNDKDATSKNDLPSKTLSQPTTYEKTILTDWNRFLQLMDHLEDVQQQLELPENLSTNTGFIKTLDHFRVSGKTMMRLEYQMLGLAFAREHNLPVNLVRSIWLTRMNFPKAQWSEEWPIDMNSRFLGQLSRLFKGGDEQWRALKEMFSTEEGDPTIIFDLILRPSGTMVKAKRDAVLEIAYLDRNNPKHRRALLDVIIEICKLMVEEDYGKGQGGQEFFKNFKLDKLGILNERKRESLWPEADLPYTKFRSDNTKD